MLDSEIKSFCIYNLIFVGNMILLLYLFVHLVLNCFPQPVQVSSNNTILWHADTRVVYIQYSQL